MLVRLFKPRITQRQFKAQLRDGLASPQVITSLFLGKPLGLLPRIYLAHNVWHAGGGKNATASFARGAARLPKIAHSPLR